MAARGTVTITPVQPKGTGVRFILNGNATFAPASNGSSGGLQIVDRPRRKAIVQWYDASPLSLDMKLIIDSGDLETSIESQCTQVLGWYVPRAGDQQPPVLQVSGKTIDQNALKLNWMLYTFSFDEALRNKAGNRVQQNISMTLYEFTPATAAILQTLTPPEVARAQQTAASSNSSRQVYVVKAGDTLSLIAARVLGNYTLWTSIASLNSIHDPNNLTVGAKLVLP